MITSDNLANAFGIAFLVGAGGLGLLLLRTAFDDMEHEWRHGERVVAVAKALALLVCLSVVGILSVAVFWVGTGRLS